MTSQDPRDPPRTYTDPAVRFTSPFTSPDPAVRFIWGCFSVLVVAATIVAIITLVNALNRGPIERTGTGPSHHAVYWSTSSLELAN